MDKRLILLALVLSVLLPTASAQYEQLIQTYAPVMKFNNGEIFYPTPVSYFIADSELKQTSNGALIDPNPTLESISTRYDDTYYLNDKLGWFEQIAADYKSKISSLKPTIYAHVSQIGGYTAIQYWFFYAFNNGPLNNHQADWEQITVIVSGDTPQWATYSEHQGGSRAAWADVEKVGTHPVVYVGRGSHANYFRSYEGKFGPQNDDVGGAGMTITSEQMDIVSLDSDNSWTAYGGRWGESGGGIAADVTGSNGPFGPKTGDHAETWNNPVAWSDSQPQTNGGTFLLNWIIYNFVLIFAIYLVTRLVIKIYGVYRVSRKQGFQFKQLIGSAFVVWLLLGIVGTAIVFVGIMMPWYSVSGSIQSSDINTQGNVPLMSIEGINGMQVNTLQKGAGMTSLFNATMPFGLIILAGVIFTVIDIIGAKHGKSLGMKYALGGVMPIAFFIIIIIVVASLGSILSSTMTPLLGKEGVPPETASLLRSVASSPFSGGYQGPMGGYANIDIKWGLGLGAYLLMIGGFLKIFAGIAMIAGAPKLSELQKLPPVDKNVAAQYSQQAMYYHAVENQPMVRQCPKCGSFSQNGDSFCQVCGTRITL